MSIAPIPRRRAATSSKAASWLPAQLGALRWRDVDLEGRNVTVSRSISAGEETSTKSRRWRVVPLAGQAQGAALP
jgi:integrase